MSISLGFIVSFMIYRVFWAILSHFGVSGPIFRATRLFYVSESVIFGLSRLKNGRITENKVSMSISLGFIVDVINGYIS